MGSASAKDVQQQRNDLQQQQAELQEELSKQREEQRQQLDEAQRRKRSLLRGQIGGGASSLLPGSGSGQTLGG